MGVSILGSILTWRQECQAAFPFDFTDSGGWWAPRVIAPMSSLCSWHPHSQTPHFQGLSCPISNYLRSLPIRHYKFKWNPSSSPQNLMPLWLPITSNHSDGPCFSDSQYWNTLEVWVLDQTVDAMGPLYVAATTPPVLYILYQKFLLISDTLERFRILANHTSNFRWNCPKPMDSAALNWRIHVTWDSSVVLREERWFISLVSTAFSLSRMQIRANITQRQHDKQLAAVVLRWGHRFWLYKNI